MYDSENDGRKAFAEVPGEYLPGDRNEAKTTTFRGRGILPPGRLYACPGFVDIHTHPSLSPEAPDYWSVGFTDWLDACVPLDDILAGGTLHPMDDAMFSKGPKPSTSTSQVTPGTIGNPASSIRPQTRNFLIEIGNDTRFFELFSKRKMSRATSLLKEILEYTGAFGIKIVNPGGVFSYNHGVRLDGWDSPIPAYDITPRQIVEGFLEIKGQEQIQIHMMDIGEPGNYRVIDGIRDLLPHLHLSHLQFYCYGGASWGDLQSRTDYVLEYADHFDIGAVFFGRTHLFSWDEPFMDGLSQEIRTGDKAAGTALRGAAFPKTCPETIPYSYKSRRFVNALQFVIGLELALSGKGAISCDFPNGGSVANYPSFMRMLVDSDFRAAILDGINPHAVSRERSRVLTLPSIRMKDAVYLYSIRPRKYLGLPTTVREARNIVVFNQNCEVIYVGPLALRPVSHERIERD